MKKFLKGLVTLVCIVGLVIIFGCASFQDLATPCHINEDVIKYSGQPATSYLPWTTVFDAERIKAYMDYEHLDTQKMWDEMKLQDMRKYSFLTERIDVGITDGRQLQQKLFDPNGSIGMAIVALFGGTIGAMFINTGKVKV
jgi:hypothetical protein